MSSGNGCDRAITLLCTQDQTYIIRISMLCSYSTNGLVNTKIAQLNLLVHQTLKPYRKSRNVHKHLTFTFFANDRDSRKLHA